MPAPQIKDFLKLPIQISKSDDYTVYVEAGVFEKALKDAWDKDHLVTNDKSKLIKAPVESIIRSNNSWDWMGTIEGKIKDGIGTASGRIHAVRCFEQKLYSITLRELKDENGIAINPDPSEEILNRLEITSGSFGLSDDFSTKDGKHYLADQRTIGALAAEAVFGTSVNAENPMRKGLILISGGTGSGKTTIMKGILQQALNAALGRNQKQRLRVRPHLVFVGDPIECFPYKGKKWKSLTKLSSLQIEGSGELANQRAFDFTARVLGRDVATIEDALIDALRETPEIYAISELRNDSDIRAALRFAETGHLVVATAHSTSLQGTFRRLIEISQAKQPSERASLVRQLHSVVHVQAMPTSSFEPLRLTTVWRGNSSGVRSFVSDGPTSLIPTRSRTQSSQTESAVLGMTWFLDKLIKKLEDADETTTRCIPDLTKRTDCLKGLISAAQLLDMESL